MKKTNVAFCLRDMQMGGVESVLIRTMDELQKNKNINLNFISFVDVKTPIYKKYFETHKNIKTYSLYPCSWLSTKLPRFFLFRIFMHMMRDVYRWSRRYFVMNKFKDIDVFIDYHDFGFYNELKKIKNAKKIAWFHSSLNVFKKRNFAKRLDGYNNIVVLTDDCANDLKELCPKYSDKILRIYNPIDIKDIKHRASETKPIDGDYFCCVSRLSGDKDIMTLLNAFEAFYRQNKKTKLVIVGDGDRASEYKNYAKKLKSAKQIYFVGMQKNPFVYMKNARANILSSFGEGLPTVLIESSVLGVLNVASDCKYGPREILLNGAGGILFKPGDVQQLAKCMVDVINNKNIVRNMVKKSDNAISRFDAKQIVKQIIFLIS